MITPGTPDTIYQAPELDICPKYPGCRIDSHVNTAVSMVTRRWLGGYSNCWRLQGQRIFQRIFSGFPLINEQIVSGFTKES